MAITLRLPPEEDRLLAEYAKGVGRTKTDILREYIRSLAPAGQWQLPGNYHESDYDGRVQGYYRGHYVDLSVGSNGYKVWVDGGYWHDSHTELQNTIVQVQSAIDKQIKASEIESEPPHSHCSRARASR